MAIVPMKRVRVLGPSDLRDRTLELLRQSAVVDPVALVEAPDAPADLVARRMTTQRVLRLLEGRAADLGDECPEKKPFTNDDDALDAVAQVEACLSRRADLESQRSTLLKDLDLIRPWQGLDPADLPALAAKGVHLALYELRPGDLDNVDLSALHWSQELELDPKRKRRGLAALQLDQAPELPLESANLPTRSAVVLEAALAACNNSLSENAAELDAHAAWIEALRHLDTRLADHIRLAEVRAGLGGDDEIFALSGWCPVPRAEDLRSALEPLPVALLLTDPEEQDEAPIALRNPPFVAQFEPLLKAFNLPHYREWDPTLLIAPFMGIFFGFCLGDVGYGIVLTALGAWALAKLKPKGEIRLAVQWILILGVCTILVGGALGNFFGIKLYETFNLGPDKLLFSLNDDPKKFFYASLAFGVVQLTVGMLVRLVREVLYARWQNAIGTIGWLGVLPIVVMLMIPMLTGSSEPALVPSWTLLIPLGIILFFASPDPNVVKRIGGGAWALYNVTGLLGDVMSYARIFGLGLSSGIIAMVVNTIAMTIAHSIPWAGWPLAILVLVGGHAFNFLMAVIGAVVHPARLQFLEYFGKFFEGGGRAYAPFRRLEGE